MSTKTFQLMLSAFVALSAVSTAFGQHSFLRTKTVDKSGRADYTTIQGAINACTQDNLKWTVLIYSDTYAENITLDGADENIDLIGVDRESVIIAPSSGDGIVITSGTETSRNNSIRNLMIKTVSGHGIKIVKGGTPVPKNITIEGVTIDAQGTDKKGITGADAEDVRVFDCEVNTDAGHGVVTGDQWTLARVNVGAKNDGQVIKDAVFLDDHDSIVLKNCDLTAEGRALYGEGCEGILAQGCRLATPGSGGAVNVATVVFGGLSKHIRLQSCVIVSDARGTSRGGPIAVFIDSAGAPTLVEDIVFQSCDITVFGGASSTSATAVKNDLDGIIDLVECNIRAQNTKQSTPASAVGVEINGIAVFGGVISTSTDAERETGVWDIKGSDEAGIDTSRISGTRLSKWHGPIKSAERPRSIVQRTINVGAPDADAILAATTLTGQEQEITSNITNPDVFRVLSVSGSQAGMNQDVYVIGTDWGGNQITDKITLTGTTPAAGVKPFVTVTKIILPGSAEEVQVSVGTTSKLGLQFPISATTDVQQQGRKSANDYYQLESVGTVEAVYATVDVSATLAAGNSFEWVVLTSQ